MVSHLPGADGHLRGLKAGDRQVWRAAAHLAGSALHRGGRYWGKAVNEEELKGIVQPLLFQDRGIFPPRKGTSITSTNFGRRVGVHPCTTTLGVGEGCKDICKLFPS